MSTSPASSLPGFPQVVRHLQRHNIFYMLSALLMLLGCFLISGPYLITLRRDVGGLLILLGTINLYEGLVVLAGGYVCRRAPRSTEGSTLLVIAQLFLLDVTFTINACLPVNLTLGIAVAGASFVLALLKIYALERAVGHPIFARMRAFQVLAILFLYSFQGLLGLYPEGNLAWKQAAAFAAWTLYGLLPLLLEGLPDVSSVPQSPAVGLTWLPGDLQGPPPPPPGLPWWQTEGFARVASLLALALLGVQVLAQSWVYETPFAWSYFAPAVVVAGAVAPRFLNLSDRFARLMLRVWIVFAVLLMLGWLGGSLLWRPGLADLRVTLSPYRITCFVAALAFLLLRRRERRRLYRDLGCACLWLGAVSYDLPSLQELLMGRPGPWPVAAGVVAGAIWLATRVRFSRALVFWLVSLVLVTRMFHAENLTADRWTEALRWGPLGLLTLCLLFGRGHALARVGLFALVWGWGVWSCMPTDGPALAYFYAAAAVLIAACALHRGLVPLLLLYLAAANMRVYGTPAGSYAAAWGWFAILLAFATLGLAVHLTRSTLQESRASEGGPAS